MAGTYLILFFMMSLILFAEEGRGFHPKCPSFHCGELGQISFPFSNRTHPECGLFVVDNCNEGYRPMIQLGKDGPWFSISNISQDNILWLHNQELQYNFYCEPLKLLNFPTNPLFSFEVASNVLILLKCPPTPHIANFSQLCNDSSQSIIYSNQNNDGPIPLTGCSVIQPLVTKTRSRVVFRNIYPSLFVLQVQVRQECYECHQGGGQCQINDKGHFHCSTSKTGNAKRHLIIVVIAIIAPGIGVLIILALCFRKTLSSHNSKVFWQKKTKNYNNIQNFLKTNGHLAPKRYRYSEIKRMTNSFKYKLGQGGYGGVYKGKLLDGCDVAVKVLNDLKGNGEEFINEVVSISRTSHVNIVRLFGYCFEGQRRALIYEFVPNGSLEKFIFEKNPRNKQLKWEKLFQIALGIARGLEYLHCDCHTRILHFDIKPHNILLDENLCPKISDFGLAKICPKRESIISMAGARGTIGYIAPELCSRQFGEVSHKSDVYSYGMMVLEMVGGRKNLDVGVDRTSEIYFPHWMYKRLELDEELGLQDIENEEDKECALKLITVSLWCIQTKPSSRPAISRVVKMLEGSLDSLQFPPKPFLSSPTPEPADPSP